MEENREKVEQGPLWGIGAMVTPVKPGCGDGRHMLVVKPMEFGDGYHKFVVRPGG
jgi:hypothetical protein